MVRAQLQPAEIVVHRRILVTTPAATCLSPARTGRPDLIETALRFGTTHAQLEQALGPGAHRPGQPRAERAVSAAADNPWSHPERLLHVLLRRAGITGWCANRPLLIAGQVVVPDVYLEAFALVLEVDGRRHHSGPAEHDADHRRQNLLTSHGCTVLRFTPRQIALEPGDLIAIVRRTIARLEQRRARAGGGTRPAGSPGDA